MEQQLTRLSRHRMLYLLLWRSLAMLSVMGIALWVYYPSAPHLQRQGLLALCVLALLLAAAQGAIIWRRWHIAAQLLCQFGADTLLVSLLVFLSGGIHSPFILLFGLVIVANGIQAHALSVVVVSIAACAGYLLAIHAYAWVLNDPLTDDSTLKILLQVSILLLVGGIMAAIANRHAGLARQSDQVVRQHQNLQRMHHQVMSSMSEGMVVLDRFLVIQDYNEAAHRIFAHAASVGMHIRQLSILPEAIARQLQNNQLDAFQCDWFYQGNNYLIQVNRLPENGNLACWLISFVDVTAMKQLEARLMEQDKLAALGRMAAMLAHELRNPMHTMSQAVDLLVRLPEEKREPVHRILHEEIHRLDRLVRDMLDYTRPLQPRPTRINMAKLITQSLQQEDAEGEKHVQVECGDIVVNEDPGHLRLVLDNLLRNALQASPTIGSVRIRCVQNDTKQWQLSVEDQGPGVDPSIEHNMFEPFSSWRHGGIGLGLATVWQACQANGWQISYRHQQGFTVFCVRSAPPATQGQETAFLHSGKMQIATTQRLTEA